MRISNCFRSHFLTLLLLSQQDVPRKHVTVKYSKYDVWQRKAAQRLRRGVPAILRAKKFRRQAERIKAQEQLHHHRPLITLPSKLPPILLPTENYVSHKWNQDHLHRVDKKRLGDQSFLSLTSFLWQSSTTLLPSPPDVLTRSSSFYSCCFVHQQIINERNTIQVKKQKKERRSCGTSHVFASLEDVRTRGTARASMNEPIPLHSPETKVSLF